MMRDTTELEAELAVVKQVLVELIRELYGPTRGALSRSTVEEFIDRLTDVQDVKPDSKEQ